jgi:hypothetical protein
MRSSICSPRPLSTTNQAPRRPINIPLGSLGDLIAIGTKWQDELRLRRTAQQIASTTYFVDSTQPAIPNDPKVLLDSLLALPDANTSHADTERLNDFLNGLDFVARDLLHRL